ncbi:MAG: demethoxyubiquinone hydroxylase family protein [Rhodospirillaceae bacterium]|jgi:3-demethoxyubiquinol 3-hydroxylase|nr:demethoxyubiquinone hydroxylase family protein [Rhodospirillaceae bacterium]MBT4932549.1 demethoxyubiquinone hydroxylase family protein [Rhodospirillaceae bacterium]MBT5242622.1 demethoxyubiquinone hydroxylase family protein [Rhodospirillaceae bacterium]MBT5562785.1 demethoxyubiquinone hydroxylase family protein [Rhodospirillaceae bacterium]MBT6241214.1 demethoxyubiquinone hydroxylase family protein [Rhodospirillaceae bacterium]
MSKEQKAYSSVDGRLPGDPSRESLIERFIRVDQAGEYGAVRIYEGQMSVLGKSESGPVISHMLAQEEAHLETFSKMIGKRRVRPTALLPLWHLAGFALGAGTALMGEKAAMACTVAVEEVIDEHYAAQVEKLEAMGGDEKELSETCEKFRLEELEHRDTAIEHGAEKAAGYEGLSALVKTGSRMAIWLSERI